MELLRLLDGRQVTEPAPCVQLRCDVLCVGAGSAGIYAAVSASESGAEVVLLENDVTVGGMHILGSVRGCYYGARGGSFEADSTHSTPFYFGKSDYKRPRLLQRLRRSDVQLRCGCTPTGLLVEDHRVRGVTYFDGTQEVAVGADMVIDATSDGFLMRILPVEKTYAHAVPFSVITTIREGDGFRDINRDSGFLDPYDSGDFSHKAVLAHAGTADLLKKGPLLQLASHTGVRQGLSFAGEARLRYEDAVLQREPERVLFWAYSDLDIHGHLRALDDELFQTWWVLCNLATVAVRIPVPMGSIVPCGWKGIVSAGRCMSTDRYAQSAVRMNRDMFRMGECVGVAAAMARDGDILAVDHGAYLRRVKERGCFEGADEKRIGFDSPHRDFLYVPLSCDPEKELSLLQSDKPGAFFWSVFRAEDRAGWADRLAKLLVTAEDTRYRCNLAIALGILEDARALPVLRQIVAERDSYWFRDGRRSNQFRSAVAVCLLGRLGDCTDREILWQIAFDEHEIDRPMYHQLKPDRLRGTGDRNFLYFDMFTHSAAALVKLCRRCGLPMQPLCEDFRALHSSGAAEERIAPKAAPEGLARSEVRRFLQSMIEATQ